MDSSDLRWDSNVERFLDGSRWAIAGQTYSVLNFKSTTEPDKNPHWYLNFPQFPRKSWYIKAWLRDFILDVADVTSRRRQLGGWPGVCRAAQPGDVEGPSESGGNWSSGWSSWSSVQSGRGEDVGCDSAKGWKRGWKKGAVTLTKDLDLVRIGRI